MTIATNVVMTADAIMVIIRGVMNTVNSALG
jgi:hypothetical protein